MTAPTVQPTGTGGRDAKASIAAMGRRRRRKGTNPPGPSNDVWTEDGLDVLTEDGFVLITES